jgi:putative endopeptidase
MKKLFISILGLICLSSCQNTAEKKEVKSDILKDDLDTTVLPGADFFNYANGGWIKRNPIPADETNWGIGQLVQEELYDRLLHINEDAMKKNERSGTSQQIGDFWAAGMDSNNVEKQGLEPLKSELNKITAIKTPQDVMQQAVAMHKYGVNVFFDDGVYQDEKNSDAYAYHLEQGGLGLPSRDYYFDKDARTTRIRDAYPHYIETMFKLMGYDENTAKAKAVAVVNLEIKMAEKSRKLEDLRDPYKNYNKIAITKLNSISPKIDWVGDLKEMGVAHVDSVVVGQPEFYMRLDQLINNENIETLKDYMSFQLVHNFAEFLSKPFADADFDFYGRLLHGATQQRPRWKRVLDAEEHAMGEALGQLFVKEYFNETAKKRYETIVENIRNAYKARMQKLDWMSDSTKQKAIHKLESITKKVGYPDKWKDFSAMKISRESYSTNMMHAREWWNNFYITKLGKPVDRAEWDMSPQTYNAYYNPSNNEIVLPAGMFTVPGYRDSELDDGLVYGYAAASTVGHEITHGFDDEGRQYDEHGNLHNWWSKKDEEEFNKRAQVLVNQFNNMVAVDTIHLRGKQSLGENLADLGGLLIGYDAFMQTDCFKKGEKINGMTPSQRFFLGYALSWMIQIRPEQIANMVHSNVHAPAKFRVNGPLPNVPGFYDAFNIKPGDKMYLPDSARVHLW